MLNGKERGQLEDETSAAEVEHIDGVCQRVVCVDAAHLGAGLVQGCRGRGQSVLWIRISANSGETEHLRVNATKNRKTNEKVSAYERLSAFTARASKSARCRASKALARAAASLRRAAMRSSVSAILLGYINVDCQIALAGDWQV